jgi:hypothetical protein
VTCKPYPQPVYKPNKNGGINLSTGHGDGYVVNVQWDIAWPSTSNYQISYNIYFSTNRDTVFSEWPKYLSISQSNFSADIIDLSPGETYFFAVRAFQYEPGWYDLNFLPDGAPGLKVYPETTLTDDINDIDLIIPIADIDIFPNYGVIQIGTELIRYTSRDIPANSLIISSINDRGFLDTNVREHQVDGYDGYYMQSPIIRFFNGFEDDNAIVDQETCNFHYPNYAYTITDGYKFVTTDILTTDLSATDENMADFPAYDYAGWRRGDPALLLQGGCIGSYIGGEDYCADSETGVGRMIRGIPMNEQAARREELLLRTTGEPCVLLRRQWTGIRCSCFMPNMEYPEARCPSCHGSGYVLGYEQFFNPRRSDGRILVRFDPATDDVKSEEDGLESEFSPTAWTLVYPAIKDRDLLIRYDQDGMREFMYEIINVTRNKLFMGELGAQKLTLQRVRRTDIYNQIRVIDDTSTIPRNITTSIGFLRGASGLLIPHTHTVKINEHVVALTQINQTTSVSHGHNHEIISGIITNILGHSHIINL